MWYCEAWMSSRARRYGWNVQIHGLGHAYMFIVTSTEVYVMYFLMKLAP